jgi:hypothetical protein
VLLGVKGGKRGRERGLFDTLDSFWYIIYFLDIHSSLLKYCEGWGSGY